MKNIILQFKSVRMMSNFTSFLLLSLAFLASTGAAPLNLKTTENSKNVNEGFEVLKIIINSFKKFGNQTCSAKSATPLT
jgi:hypothetical protein